MNAPSTRTPQASSPLDRAEQVIARVSAQRTETAPNAQLEALGLAISANLPVLLWGEPGVGKSSVLSQLASELHLHLETVIASVHEPSDFAGLPIVGDDPTAGVPMAPPDWAVRLAKRGSGLVFFDELSSAPPAVQAALLRVVLERRVGSLELPAKVRVIAAANPPSSAADGWHLSPPLANRFIHLRWTHKPEVVARGMSGVWPTTPVPKVDANKIELAVAQARGVITAFLTARPGLVHHMPNDADGRGGAWPSPRTWEMALRLLAVGLASPGCSKEALTLALLGAVGDGAGSELNVFLEQLDLPDPNQVLANPDAFVLPKRGDRQLACLTSVVSVVENRLTEERWRAAWKVLAKAVQAGVPDVAARAAVDLARLRDERWVPPAEVEAFIEVLRLSGVQLGQR